MLGRFCYTKGVACHRRFSLYRLYCWSVLSYTDVHLVVLACNQGGGFVHKNLVDYVTYCLPPPNIIANLSQDVTTPEKQSRLRQEDEMDQVLHTDAKQNIPQEKEAQVPPDPPSPPPINESVPDNNFEVEDEQAALLN